MNNITHAGKLFFLISFLGLIDAPLTVMCQLIDNSGSEQPLKWELITDSAGWKPRDSSGELVYKNKLWILGGWYNSFEPPPRDVWSSKDGSKWKLVNPKAPWRHSDFPMTVVFKNKMWIMGGWYNGRLPDHSASNSVWWSKNGKEWHLKIDSAGWTPRIGGGLVVFKGKMWMIGGTENYYFGDSTSLKNDVWYSKNGKDWHLATANAGWAPRAFHGAVVMDDKIWIMGGGNYVPNYLANNDVWSSEDGIHWIKVMDNAPWSTRIWFSSIIYRDKMWVLGGWSNNPSRNWNDVWYSGDGKIWEQLELASTWRPRHEHSSYVFKDRIWLAGGNVSPLTNEVWCLEIPHNWLKRKKN